MRWTNWNPLFNGNKGTQNLMLAIKKKKKKRRRRRRRRREKVKVHDLYFLGYCLCMYARSFKIYYIRSTYKIYELFLEKLVEKDGEQA